MATSTYEQGDVALAFGALLDVARAAGSTMRTTVADDKTSPSLMFEPPSVDARDRRLATLKQDDRQYLQRQDEMKLRSLTSVTHAQGRNGSAGRDGVPHGVDRAFDRPGARLDLSRIGSPHGVADLRNGDVRTVGSDTPVTAVTDQTRQASGNGRNADPRFPFQAVADDNRTTLAAGTTPPVPSGGSGIRGSGGSTPAQQVASILSGEGAGRPSPTGGARSPSGSVVSTISANGAAPSAAEGERPTGAKPTTQGQTGSDGALKTSSSGRAAGGEPAFDRFDALVRAIRLFADARVSRVSSARLHLQPPELGRIHVHLRVIGNDLQLEVRTETEEARELLAGRATALASALEQHGIHVQRFDLAREAHDPPPFGDAFGDGGDAEDFGQQQAALTQDAPFDGREGFLPSGPRYAWASESDLVAESQEVIALAGGFNRWEGRSSASLGAYGVDIRV